MGWKQSRRFWSVLPIIFDAGAGQTVYGKVLLHMLLTSMEELVGGRCQGCWQPWLQKDHGVQDLERSEEGKYCIEGNISKTIDQLTRCALLDLLFRNKEELVKHMKVRGNLGNSGPETVVFKILREVSKTDSGTTVWTSGE